MYLEKIKKLTEQLKVKLLDESRFHQKEKFKVYKKLNLKKDNILII